MIRKLVTAALMKKLIAILYNDVVYPVAVSYVAKTENNYDDRALKFLNDFIMEFLNEVPNNKEGEL